MERKRKKRKEKKPTTEFSPSSAPPQSDWRSHCVLDEFCLFYFIFLSPTLYNLIATAFFFSEKEKNEEKKKDAN